MTKLWLIHLVLSINELSLSLQVESRQNVMLKKGINNNCWKMERKRENSYPSYLDCHWNVPSSSFFHSKTLTNGF